jgi:hypothetical protein
MKNKHDKPFRPKYIYKLISSITDTKRRNLLRGYSAKDRLSPNEIEQARRENTLHNSVILGAILKGPLGLWDGYTSKKKKTSDEMFRMTSFPSISWRNEVCFTAGYINSCLGGTSNILELLRRLARLDNLTSDEALDILLELSKEAGVSNFLSYKLAYIRSSRNLDPPQLAKINDIEEEISHRGNAGLHFSALENLSSKVSLFVVARRRVGALVGKVDGNIRKAISLSNFIPTPLDESDVGGYLLRATESCLIDTIYAVIVIFNLHAAFPAIRKEFESRLDEGFINWLNELISYANEGEENPIVTDYFRAQNVDSELTLDVYRTSAAFLERTNLAIYRNKLDRVVGARLLSEILGEKYCEKVEPFNSKEFLLAPDGSNINIAFDMKLDTFIRSFLFLKFISNRTNILSLTKEDIKYIFENTMGLDALLTESEMRALYLSVPSDAKSLVAVLALALYRKKSIDPDVDFEFRTDFISHVKNFHNGSIVDFIEYLLADTPQVANYIVGSLDELTLEKMYSLITNVSGASGVRCDILRAVGKKLNRIEYFIEADAITTRSKVSSLQQYFDSSRMYVDSISMKKWLDSNPSIATEQYRALYPRIEAKLSTIGTEDSNKMNVIVIKVNDKDNFLISEVAKDAFEQFCLNTEFGIESYLGRRIRHNTLDGVTTETVDAVFNKPEYRVLLSNSNMRKTVSAWKLHYKSIVDKLRREHLQFKSSSSSSLFKYALDLSDATTKGNIHQLSSTFQDAGGSELLSELVIAFCWKQITPQLENAALFIKNTVLREANASIDKFFIGQFGADEGRMKVDLHGAVNEIFKKVADWFQVPRTGFTSASTRDLCQIILIDINRNNKVDFVGNAADNKYTGIGVHRLYDCLYVLLQNAHKHARSDCPILISIFTGSNAVSSQLDSVQITVTSSTTEGEYIQHRQRIQQAICASETGIDMVTEGYSGIKKVKFITRATEGRSTLTCDTNDNTFELSLTFSLHMEIANDFFAKGATP